MNQFLMTVGCIKYLPWGGGAGAGGGLATQVFAESLIRDDCCVEGGCTCRWGLSRKRLSDNKENLLLCLMSELAESTCWRGRHVPPYSTGPHSTQRFKTHP